MKDRTENRKGYKKTKIGWIPEDWETSMFGSVFDFLTSYSYTRKDLQMLKPDERRIINIHYGDIHSKYELEMLDFNIEKKVPVLKKEVKDYKKLDLLKDGDLIIADASEDYNGICDSIELLNVGHKKVTGGLHTIIARDRKGLTLIGYRCFVLKNPCVHKNLKRVSNGISVYGISKSSLASISIPIPPLKEQYRISNLLHTWDRTIHSLTQLIQQKQNRKKWLMQVLLTGKKRLPGFKNEWKTMPLNFYIDYSPRPVDKPNSNFLSLGLRSHGKGVFHKENFNPDKIAIDTLYEVKENDLIVNITFAWEHAIAIAEKKDDGGLVSHRFPTYSFNKNNADSKFFKYFVLMPRFKYLLGLISPGGAGRNRVMSKRDLLKLEIKAPSFDEQSKISEFLIIADKEIEILNQKLELLKAQKKGLMQQLLTGRKRLVNQKNEDDE